MKISDQTIKYLVTFDVSGDEEDDLFASLFSEDEEEEDVSLEEDPEKETDPEGTDDDVEQEEEPEKETPPKPADEEQPPVAETEKEKLPVTPEPEPESEEEEVIPQKEEVDPEKQEAEMDKFRSELQQLYAITDEDADAILTEPATVLPKLMANANMIMLKQVGQMMQQFQQSLPQIINQTMATKTVETQRLDALKQAYPDLMVEDKVPFVVQAINTLKQANPKIKFDDLVKKAGPVAYALMGTMPVEKAPPAAAPKVDEKPKPFITPRSTSSAPPAKKLSEEEKLFQSLIEDL